MRRSGGRVRPKHDHDNAFGADRLHGAADAHVGTCTSTRRRICRKSRPVRWTDFADGQRGQSPRQIRSSARANCDLDHAVRADDRTGSRGAATAGRARADGPFTNVSQVTSAARRPVYRSTSNAIRRTARIKTMTSFHRLSALSAITLGAALSMTAGLAFAGDKVSADQILNALQPKKPLTRGLSAGPQRRSRDQGQGDPFRRYPAQPQDPVAFAGRARRKSPRSRRPSRRSIWRSSSTTTRPTSARPRCRPRRNSARRSRTPT